MNTDANGRIWLNWNTKFYKQTGMEFINNPIEAPFVIFGTTAEGITNPVPTPAGAKYPHEIQANILHNLITGTAPSIPTWVLGAEIAGTFFALLLLAFATRSVWFSLPSLLLIVGGSVYASLKLYESSYLFDVSGIVILSVLFWAYHSFLSFLSEYRQETSNQTTIWDVRKSCLGQKITKRPNIAEIGWVDQTYDFSFF